MGAGAAGLGGGGGGGGGALGGGSLAGMNEAVAAHLRAKKEAAGVLAWLVVGRVLSLQTFAPPPLLSALAWGGLVGCLAAAAPWHNWRG